MGLFIIHFVTTVTRRARYNHNLAITNVDHVERQKISSYGAVFAKDIPEFFEYAKLHEILQKISRKRPDASISVAYETQCRKYRGSTFKCNSCRF